MFGECNALDTAKAMSEILKMQRAYYDTLSDDDENKNQVGIDLEILASLLDEFKEVLYFEQDIGARFLAAVNSSVYHKEMRKKIEDLLKNLEE